jgi:hypothetical protein
LTSLAAVGRCAIGPCCGLLTTVVRRSGHHGGPGLHGLGIGHGVHGVTSWHRAHRAACAAGAHGVAQRAGRGAVAPVWSGCGLVPQLPTHPTTPARASPPPLQPWPTLPRPCADSCRPPPPRRWVALRQVRGGRAGPGQAGDGGVPAVVRDGGAGGLRGFVQLPGRLPMLLPPVGASLSLLPSLALSGLSLVTSHSHSRSLARSLARSRSPPRVGR